MLRFITPVILVLNLNLPWIQAEDSPYPFKPLSYTTDATSSEQAPLPAIQLGGVGTTGDGEPGCILTIHSFVNGATDARSAPLIALQVPEGAPPTPFLPPGPFEATWSGIMQFENAAEYLFFAEGRGEILVDIHDEIVIDGSAADLSVLQATPTLFEMGHHPFSIRYRSPENGEGAFKLYWQTEGVPKEPISPLFLTTYWPTKDLEKGQRLRRGRNLFAEHRCHKCHALPFPLDEEHAMPELGMDSPTLDGAAERLSESWLVEWTIDPHAYRPTSTMPKGLVDREEAKDIVAFLKTPNAFPLQAEIPADERSIAMGEELFLLQDCQTCHLLDGVESDEDLEIPIDLNRVSEKWKPGPLASFLMKPEEHFAWTEMPNFGLSQEEANALAAFLLKDSTRVEREADKRVGNPEKGRELLQSKRCLNCHDLVGMVGSNMASPISDWDPHGLDQGCLYASPLGTENSLDHGLSEEETEALGEFVREGLPSLNRYVPAEFAERQIEQLRCINCHGDPRAIEKETIEAFVPFTRFFSQPVNGTTGENDFEDVWGEEIEEATPTASEHQTRPYLTWAGEKLQQDWNRDLLSGSLPYKTRPLLPARMPSFPSRAVRLAQGMAQLHGVTEEESHPTDAELADIGDLIIGQEGLKCRSCHAIGDQPSISGPQGASINLDLAPDRLRYPFFERLLRNPQRVLPGTPMPQFILPDGSTPLSASLEMKSEPQIQAMWQALQALQSHSY
jgi:cytochrome c2